MSTTTDTYARVILDGSVPRTARQRCEKLFEYLVSISVFGPHQESDPAFVQRQLDEAGSSVMNADQIWAELEGELQEKISAQLPSIYTIVAGEQQPGDVIVREEDPCACGTVFGENSMYLVHAAGRHPNCSG